MKIPLARRPWRLTICVAWRILHRLHDCVDVCPYNEGRVVGGVFYSIRDEHRVEHMLSSFGVRAQFTLDINENRSSLGWITPDRYYQIRLDR